MERPYLTRAETNERLQVLGFTFSPGSDLPDDTEDGRKKLQALMDLIGGAIASWVNLEDDIRDGFPGEVHQELQEWAQEWLVG